MGSLLFGTEHYYESSVVSKVCEMVNCVCPRLCNKQELYGSLPIGVLCLILVLVSIIFPYWVTKGSTVATDDTVGPTPPPSFVSDVSFGLWTGTKTKTRGGSCTRVITWVCNSGVCMLSCGKTRRDRKADIENILGPNNYTSSSGDEFFCPPCKGVANEDKKAAENDILEMEMSNIIDDPKSTMVRHGMYISTCVFLVVGLFFTFINIIFMVLNIARTPVSSISGIDGLVAWNLIAGLMYFFVLVLWGAEFNIKLKKNLGISDTLRPGKDLDTSSRVGWCCLLLICPMFLHLGLGVMFARSQWKKYYNSKTRREEQMKKDVQDPTQGGTDIIF